MEIRKYDYTEMNFMKLQGKCERAFPYITFLPRYT